MPDRQTTDPSETTRVAALKRLDAYWNDRNAVAVFLFPLSLVFAVAAWTRRRLYRLGILRARRLGVPVIVVGNLTVGGTGKTPLVIWVARS